MVKKNERVVILLAVSVMGCAAAYANVAEIKLMSPFMWCLVYLGMVGGVILVLAETLSDWLEEKHRKLQSKNQSNEFWSNVKLQERHYVSNTYTPKPPKIVGKVDIEKTSKTPSCFQCGSRYDEGCGLCNDDTLDF